ncbi:hypothetical protein WJX74_000786 [Apatococcus lobatus]|uniref:SDR family oxidoreductase n=1 Tax=Apatococcus lobatus TaxID=904363 RepID=A0AAW1SA50_9CHLO
MCMFDLHGEHQRLQDRPEAHKVGRRGNNAHAEDCRKHISPASSCTPGTVRPVWLYGLKAGLNAGRAGQPADVAKAVRFLCDNEQAAFICGQQLMVDGGVSAKLIFPD